MRDNSRRGKRKTRQKRKRKEEWIREGKKEGKGCQTNKPNCHKKTDWHVEEKCHKTAEKRAWTSVMRINDV